MECGAQTSGRPASAKAAWRVPRIKGQINASIFIATSPSSALSGIVPIGIFAFSDAVK
jgi:hypothetical protein